MNIGVGFSMLDSHKRAFLIHGNPFSVSCQLINTEKGNVSQGSLNDDSDTLRGLPSQIGLTISADTGLGTVGKTVEFLLDINDVKIGEPIKGWRLIFPDRQGNRQQFVVEENIQDDTIGVYRLRLSRATQEGKVNRIQRRGC
jgi:hypothetical protein